MPLSRALVGTSYRRGVVALVVLTFAWRVWTISRWSWQNDDWQFIEGSISMPLLPYLFHEHSGHIVPGVFLVTDLMTKLAPLDFDAVILIISVACAGNVLIWGRAFERITGGNILALVPLAILALSPVMVEPMQWWSASALAIPIQISLGLMVVAACRWTASSHRRDLAWFVLAYVLGLFFWQKAVLLTVPAAFVLLALAEGSLRERLRRIVPPVAALVAVTLPYLALFRYLTQRASASYDIELTAGGTSFGEAVNDYARGFADMFLPALLGGPWGSMQTDHYPFSQPAPTVTTVVLVICAVGLAWVAARKPRTVWLLLLPLTYTVLSLGVVLFSTRAEDIWDVMALERYFVDPVVVAMLTGALMLRAGRPDRSEASVPSAGRLRLRLAVIALVATSLVVSNLLAADRIGIHRGREWVGTLRADVGRVAPGGGDQEPLVLWDGYAPDTVLQAVWWNQSALLSSMLLPFRDKITFGEPSGRLHMVQDDGHIVPMQISRLSTASQGPDPSCGYYVEPGRSVEVPMSSPLFHWGWGLEVTAFSATGGELVVDLGSTEVDLEMPSGQHTRGVQIDGEVAPSVAVTVPSGSPGAFCINDIHVGEPEPVS